MPNKGTFQVEKEQRVLSSHFFCQSFLYETLHSLWWNCTEKASCIRKLFYVCRVGVSCWCLDLVLLQSSHEHVPSCPPLMGLKAKHQWSIDRPHHIFVCTMLSAVSQNTYVETWWSYFALHTSVLLCLTFHLASESRTECWFSTKCCPASFTHQGDLLQWGVSFNERLHKASAFEDVLKVTCNKFITLRVMKKDSRAQKLYSEHRESDCGAQHRGGDCFSM